MEHRMFSQIWDQLRVKKGQYPRYLEQVNIRNLRGIRDLSISFNYPVTVIAGPNASGKSTVLFACACAYEPENANPRNFTPASLFPNLKIVEERSVSDREQETAFEFYYSMDRKRQSMRWAKGIKSWNKSYLGQKNGRQPKNTIYVRTLANLTSPSEIRAFLQISNSPNLTISPITADLLAFAQRILPLRYAGVSLVKKDQRDLLFANRVEDNLGYSEFHMSAGERAILRISKDISQLHNSLILIDEIEAGLHPYTQQQLMLELHRIALRNNLQIIVTSHSPVILDAVPSEARIFLERTADNVLERPAYKDIIQKALYGQSTEKLSLLCEDELGESFVLGVLDELNPKLNLVHDDMIVGKDTGKTEFPAHITALGKFGKLNEFIFILDGDAREMDSALKAAASKVQPNALCTPLYLPGTDIPEAWAWDLLKSNTERYAQVLGLHPSDLEQRLLQEDQLFDNAADKKTNIVKNKFASLCDKLRRPATELMRLLSREELRQGSGQVKVFAEELEHLIRNWQSRK